MKMNLRDVGGRSLLSGVTALLFLTSVAHAQEEPATGGPGDTPAAPTATEGDSPAASDKGATAKEPTKTDGMAPATDPKPPGTKSTQSATDSRPKPQPLALELLPSTAYPSRPI